MTPAVLHLPRIVLLIVGLTFVACTGSPTPLPPQPAARSESRPDYFARRIGGRETLKLPGIGTVHADHRQDVENGVLLSGRVFLEVALPPAGEKPVFLYAYAERARCNTKGSLLYLEGHAIVEGPHLVHQSTEADTQIYFDETGKVTTRGGHETLFY
jgi:hypothetical protein